MRLQEEDEDEEHGQNGEGHFTRNTHVKLSLDLIFCIQFIFDVFSTVMSPKDVLIVKLKVVCIGIMQEHPQQSLYTHYCVILNFTSHHDST